MTINDFHNYLNYFLDAFKCDEKLKVEIVCDREDINVFIANISSSVSKHDFSQLSIKLDDETISFFGDYIPDIFIDEFDNTWDKCSSQEIYAILDSYTLKYKEIINFGYKINYYEKEKRVHTLFEVIKDEKHLSNTEYLLSLANKGDSIDKISLYNFYGEPVKTLSLVDEKSKP